MILFEKITAILDGRALTAVQRFIMVIACDLVERAFFT